MVYMEPPEVYIVLPSLKRKVQLCFHLSTGQVREKGFFAACVLLFVSADNGGPVARGKAPLLCSFLCPIELKSRVLRKICFYFFCHKLNLFSGANSPLKGMLSLQNHLDLYSIKL